MEKVSFITNEPTIVKILREEEKTGMLQSTEKSSFEECADSNKLEEALQENKQLYRTLVDRANDGIAIIQDNKVEFLNYQAAHILGYTIEEMEGTDFSKYLHPKVRNVLIQRYKDKMTGKNTPDAYESLLLKKNGEAVSVEINSSLINYNRKPADMVIIRDITNRKKAEEKLQESEKRFRNLAELLPEIVFEMDPQGILNFVNKQSFKKTGYSREDFEKGFNAISFLIPEDRERAMQNIRKVMNGEKIDPQEYTAQRKDGKIFPINIYSSPIIKDGRPVGLRGIIIDITMRKKRENELKEVHKKLLTMNRGLEEKVNERTAEIQQILRQKENFINQLSHDLRGPLTPVVNLLPILENTEDDPKSKELIGIIRRNIDYIKNLVVKTLDLARLNNPKIVFDLEDVNLREEAENSIKDHQIMYNGKDFTIENKIDENIFVKADKLQLSEVFKNLINNAAKYSSIGSPIAIDADDGGDFVTVSIMDSGAGMNEEQLSHIFDEFYKADKSRHDFYSTGLGLSICKCIVEKHGGQIWAESPGLGKGSTIYFTIPIGSKKG